MKTIENLDIEIAEKLFGYRLESDGYWRSPDGEDAIKGDEAIRWSTDQWLAMKVLDELRRRGYRVLMNMDSKGFHLRHVASITDDGIRNEKVYHCDKPLGSADTLETLPAIICRVALFLIK